MKLLCPKHFLIYLSCFLLFCSCEKEEMVIQYSEVVGKWKLTELRSPIAFDINNDGISSFNILSELNCTNDEVLNFDALGGVQSVYTFNYSHKIAETSAGTYMHEVECGNELLAWATDYLNEGSDVYFLERKSEIKGNQLFTKYENSIDIYNSDFSEIVESLEVIMVYTKIQD